MKFWSEWDKFWDNCERNMFQSTEKEANIPRWKFYFRFGLRLALIIGFIEMFEILSNEFHYSIKKLLLKWLLIGVGGAVFVRFFTMRNYKYFLKKGWKPEKDDETTS
ncbi:MAG: hypothetical protein ACE5FF_06775 [Saprospiraceae bacterium]